MFPTPFDLPLTDPRHPFHLEHMAMALDEAAAAAEDEVPSVVRRCLAKGAAALV